MIWASTRDGLVTYVGPEWTAFTGQPTQAALGRGWLDMVHVDDRDDTESLFKHACATMAAFTIEYRLFHVSETYAAVIAGAVPSISPMDRSFIGYLGTINEMVTASSGTEALVGTATFTSPTDATRPLTPVDLVADYLLLARSTALEAGEDRLLASLDFAISEVMRRLGYGATDGKAH